MSVNQNRINSVELGTSHKQSKHSPIKRYIIGNNWLCESVRVPSKDPRISLRNRPREIVKSLFEWKKINLQRIQVFLKRTFALVDYQNLPRCCTE